MTATVPILQTPRCPLYAYLPHPCTKILMKIQRRLNGYVVQKMVFQSEAKDLTPFIATKQYHQQQRGLAQSQPCGWEQQPRQ